MLKLHEIPPPQNPECTDHQRIIIHIFSWPEKEMGLQALILIQQTKLPLGQSITDILLRKKSWTIRLTCTWHRAKIIINPFLVQIEPIWERFLFLSRNTILLGFWYYIYSQHYRQSGESDYSVLYTKGYPSRRSLKLKKMTRNISFPGPSSCSNGDVLP